MVSGPCVMCVWWDPSEVIQEPRRLWYITSAWDMTIQSPDHKLFLSSMPLAKLCCKLQHLQRKCHDLDNWSLHPCKYFSDASLQQAIIIKSNPSPHVSRENHCTWMALLTSVHVFAFFELKIVRIHLPRKTFNQNLGVFSYCRKGQRARYYDELFFFFFFFWGGANLHPIHSTRSFVRVCSKIRTTADACA